MRDIGMNCTLLHFSMLAALLIIPACEDRPKSSPTNPWVVLSKLPVCEESRKNDEQIKKLFYENIVRNSPLPNYRLRDDSHLSDYEVIRDSSHAPHRGYFTYEEYMNANEEYILITESEHRLLKDKNFRGTFRGGVRQRIISNDQILYQIKSRSYSPVPGQTNTHFWFDDCGRFVNTQDPNEIRP